MTGTSTKGPITAANAAPLCRPNTATATNAKTFEGVKSHFDPGPGLRFGRTFTTAGSNPFDEVEWQQRDAVIGDPVRHSLSPIVHNRAFEVTGLDWTYVAFEVAETDVPAALVEGREPEILPIEKSARRSRSFLGRLFGRSN